MSDMKLYRGINNIDDDLIEEANCKQKPVIHHCYAIAASAAAVLIAAGATGMFNNSRPARKPDISENAVVSESPVTTSSADAEKIAVTSGKSVRTSRTSSSTVSSVSDTKSSPSTASGRPATTVSSSYTDKTETFTVDNKTEAVHYDSSSVQNYDFEFEGSIIMKKYAALLSSLLMLTNGTTAHAQQEVYVPENDDIVCAEATKEFIEGNDIDLDLNSDGTFDIFDIYAFYRSEISERNDLVSASTGGKIPENIWEKYKALPKEYLSNETVIDPETGEKTVYHGNYTLDTISLLDYYLTYKADMKTDYLEPDFYIDTCKEDYQDDFPYEFIKNDVDKWNMWNFQKTMYLKKNDDGTFRYYTSEDADQLSEQFKSNGLDYMMKGMKQVHISPIHGFIQDVRYIAHETAADYQLVKEFAESDYADPDIDSNGKFDFDDIVKLASYSHFCNDGNRNSFIDDIFRSGQDYNGTYNDHIREQFTENEWNKALSFFDTAGFYFNDNNREIVRYIAQYYLINNEVDDKYFDPSYYEEKGLAQYNPRSYNNDEIFGNTGYYKHFSETYGPTSARKEESPEFKKRFGFTQDDINAAFPGYYKKVKTGVLPKPDIDLNGKIEVADYNILYNLSYEEYSPYDYGYIGSMIRRYPELNVVIDVPQNVRDNFNTNFDFNNNGISCDALETDCMLMYILNDLESQYSDKDELDKALDTYYAEHPELQYYEVFIKNLEEFKKTQNIESTEQENSAETANVMKSVEILKSYSSFININSLPTGNGDTNGDGNVDISDAVLIMQYISNPSKYGINGSENGHITDEGRYRADVDGEGITNMDALIIQKHLLGLCDIN